MKPIDIIILLAAIILVLYPIINYFYRKSKKLPTGECAMCSIKSERTLKEIRKALKKK